MNKTNILGIAIIVGKLAQAATDYLQGHPVNYSSLIEGITAGLGLIFMRNAVQKGIDAAQGK